MLYWHRDLCWLWVGVLFGGVTTPSALAVPPWETNTPIVSVQRELYVSHPEPDVGVFVWQQYVGPGLEREEVRSWMSESDTPEAPKRRLSSDNGRTWSGWQPLPDMVTYHNGIRIFSDFGGRECL